MEKIRRKRINNSLDQLRTLLPHSVNMKKDMASLLEQTVEYINIMHTVLNEDKPACLNKVYLSYRQKTEEIESFRKSFKKPVKRSKQEPGCSWSQPCHHGYTGQGSMEVEPFLKHSCMTTPYYEQMPPRVNNTTWQHQQKNPDPFLQNQPSFSGQSQNQFIPIPQHSVSQRSLFYSSSNPPLTGKPFETANVFSSSQGNGEAFEHVQNNKANQPLMKLDSWQPLSSGCQQVFSSRQTPAPVDPLITNKMLPSLNQTNDWCRGFYSGAKNMSVESQCMVKTGPVQGKVVAPYCDENNNTQTSPIPACCGNAESSPVKADMDSMKATPVPQNQMLPEDKVEQGDNIPSVHCDITSAAMATGILKCRSGTKTGAGSSPDMFFANSNNEHSDGNNAYGSLGSWMTPCSLPPLSLTQNFIGPPQPTCNVAMTTSTPSEGAAAKIAEK